MAGKSTGVKIKYLFQSYTDKIINTLIQYKEIRKLTSNKVFSPKERLVIILKKGSRPNRQVAPANNNPVINSTNGY